MHALDGFRPPSRSNTMFYGSRGWWTNTPRKCKVNPEDGRPEDGNGRKERATKHVLVVVSCVRTLIRPMTHDARRRLPSLFSPIATKFSTPGPHCMSLLCVADVRLTLLQSTALHTYKKPDVSTSNNMHFVLNRLEPGAFFREPDSPADTTIGRNLRHKLLA